MLKLFDYNKNPIGYIWKYKDLKVEGELSTGDKTLSFTYLAKTHGIKEEYYIQDRTDEYVAKEINISSDGFTQVVAKLNLEDLEGSPWEKFQVADTTVGEAARLALVGTGWRVGECTVTKRRNAGILNANALTIIDRLCTVFMCERVYDTKNKTVSFYEKVGEDKGVYFINGLNLKKISEKSDTYDYYTRIRPVGKDGLTIESVNGGKGFLENYQYSGKAKTYLWVDESYEDPQALKEDAQAKLSDLSKPLKSYSADIIDLAKRKPGYSILSFGLGDTVTLIDGKTGTKDKQRIVKLVEYPQDPDKNTCELANAALTFEELQQKIKDAADIINTVVTPDGRFSGKVSVDDILKFEDGVSGSNAMAQVRQDYLAVSGELAAVKATVGQIDANYVKAEEADIKYATIGQLDVTNQAVHTIQGDYADFKTVTANELAAAKAKITDLEASQVTTDYLKANYADIGLANIKNGCITTAMMGTGVVGTAQIADGCITSAKIVELTANKITAGTLSVERLEIRGSQKSLVYALNNITGALQAKNVNTLNGEVLTPKTITADKIVAKSITANEIAARTINANNIAVGAITASEMAVGTITAASGVIADAAITSAKIASMAVTNAKIANATIEAAKIKSINANTITTGTMSADRIDVEGLFAKDITATGTITGATINGATINGSSIKCGDRLRIQSNGDIYLDTILFVGSQRSDGTYADAGYIIGFDDHLQIHAGDWLNVITPQVTLSGTISSPNWFRSTGNTGWYNATYNGGIHMTDTTWVRVYNGKKFYCQNGIQTEGDLLGGNAYAAAYFFRNVPDKDGTKANRLLSDWNVNAKTMSIGYGAYQAGYATKIYGSTIGLNAAAWVSGRFTAGEHIAFSTNGRGLYGKHTDGSTLMRIVYAGTSNAGAGGSAVNCTIHGDPSYRTYLTGASIYASRSITQYSDIRLKKDFGMLDGRYLAMFDNMVQELFAWNTPHEDGRRQLGYVAQRVLRAMEDAGIAESENTIICRCGDADRPECGEILSLDYNGLSVITAYALKDARETARQQGADMEILKNKYMEALSRIAALEIKNQMQQQQIDQLQRAG